MKTAEVYLEGMLVRMISKRVPMFTDLGLYLVGSLIICVKLGASSLDCRTVGVLSMSQFRSPHSTNSEDRWGLVLSLSLTSSDTPCRNVSNSDSGFQALSAASVRKSVA
jgi:hypothetical protein